MESRILSDRDFRSAKPREIPTRKEKKNINAKRYQKQILAEHYNFAVNTQGNQKIRFPYRLDEQYITGLAHKFYSINKRLPLTQLTLTHCGWITFSADH